jgi:hypothetical protein
MPVQYVIVHQLYNLSCTVHCYSMILLNPFTKHCGAVSVIQHWIHPCPLDLCLDALAVDLHGARLGLATDGGFGV